MFACFSAASRRSRPLNWSATSFAPAAASSSPSSPAPCAAGGASSACCASSNGRSSRVPACNWQLLWAAACS